MKAPTSDSGIAIAGTAAARGLPRKRKITAVTISSASTRVLMTSLIDALMKVLASNATAWLIPLRKLPRDLPAEPP